MGRIAGPRGGVGNFGARFSQLVIVRALPKCMIFVTTWGATAGTGAITRAQASSLNTGGEPETASQDGV